MTVLERFENFYMPVFAVAHLIRQGWGMLYKRSKAGMVFAAIALIALLVLFWKFTSYPLILTAGTAVLVITFLFVSGLYYYYLDMPDEQ